MSNHVLSKNFDLGQVKDRLQETSHIYTLIKSKNNLSTKRQRALLCRIL